MMNIHKALVDITYHQDEDSPTYHYFDTSDMVEKTITGGIEKGKSGAWVHHYKKLYLTQTPIQMFLEKMIIMKNLCTIVDDNQLCFYDETDRDKRHRLNKTMETLLLIASSYSYGKDKQEKYMQDKLKEDENIYKENYEITMKKLREYNEDNKYSSYDQIWPTYQRYLVEFGYTYYQTYDPTTYPY